MSNKTGKRIFTGLLAVVIAVVLLGQQSVLVTSAESAGSVSGAESSQERVTRQAETDGVIGERTAKTALEQSVVKRAKNASEKNVSGTATNASEQSTAETAENSSEKSAAGSVTNALEQSATKIGEEGFVRGEESAASGAKGEKESTAPGAGENESAGIPEKRLRAPAGDTAEIYLNGKDGDDAADGKTPETAVRTFGRAKELATADQNVTTIYITGTADVSGEVSLQGTNAVIKREASFDGYLMRVGASATAALSDITLDGNSGEAKNTTKSLIFVDGTLNIKDGAVLQNNVLTDLDYFHAMGGAINTNNWGSGKKVINMTGGLIQNNSANYGGGIFLNHAVLNMSDGIIQSNRAVDGIAGGMSGVAAGGGVTLYNGSTFNLSGGSIQNNTSDNLGGGISIGTGVTGSGMDTLNMTGGIVTGNTAGSGGGGILVQAGLTNAYGTATISGGKITDNDMSGKGTGNDAFGGGGIYVNGYSRSVAGYHNGVLNLNNAVIRDNTAEMEGGGYASCPNSETYIYVKNGVAIYDNRADSAREIYILASNAYGAHSGDPVYSIAPSMLGGTPYHWRYEDGSEVPLNKLDGQLMADKLESLSLHTDVKSDARAEELAKVIISGNTSATRGAGIGSNGTVNMGEKDVTEVKVAKSWNDQDGAKRPGSIRIDLYRTDSDGGNRVYIGYETMEPDENGDWALTFRNLPKNDDDGNSYVYFVKERELEGYASEVTGDMDAGFTITNTPVPVPKKQEDVTVRVQKKWDDSKDHEGITVWLLADGKRVDGKKLVLSKENGWQGVFSGLPMCAEDGHEIAYKVEEEKVPGYTASYSSEEKKTRTHWVMIDAPEELEAGREYALAVQNWMAALWGNSNAYYFLKDAGNDSVIGLDSIDAGDVFRGIHHVPADPPLELGFDEYLAEDYAASMPKAERWILTGNGGGWQLQSLSSGRFLTLKGENKAPIAYSFITSMKNGWKQEENWGYGVNYSNTLTLTPGNDRMAKISSTQIWGWPTPWQPPMYISLQMGQTPVAEQNPDNAAQFKFFTPIKETEYSWTIKNTSEPTPPAPPAETMDISGTKTWSDKENQDGVRPDKITIRLMANGKEVQSRTVTAKDNWTYSFTGLPVYENGQKIVYTVTEDAVSGYSAEVKGYDVINTHVPDKTSFFVTKVWKDSGDKDGIRPDRVVVHLLANGRDTGRTITLNSGNGWSGSFQELDMYAEGKPIKYTVSEEAVSGYKVRITGDSTKGYTITNSHTPEHPRKHPGTKKPGGGTPGGTPGTGDSTHITRYIIVLILALAGLAVSLLLLRRRRRKS